MPKSTDEFDNPSPKLPQEIWASLFKFLPSYQLLGEDNSVERVSKAFQAGIKYNESSVKSRKTLPALIESCKKPEEVLFILSNGGLVKRLPFKEGLLRIVSVHPAILSDALLEELDRASLIYLGEHQPALAKRILDKQALWEKLTKERGVLIAGEESASALIQLGKSDLSVAEEILKNKKNLGEGFRDFDWMSQVVIPLGVSHIKIAADILKQPQDYFYLAMLGEAHLSIAQKILNEPLWRGSLKARDWVRLCTVNPHASAEERVARLSIAKEIIKKGLLLEALNTEALGDELVGRIELVSLGEHHLEIAEHILDTPELLRRLRTCPSDGVICTFGNVLARLGAAHIVLAEKILKDKELEKELNVANLVTLGVAHISIAEKVLRDKVVRKKLNAAHLTRLGAAYIDIANKILEDEEFLKKLRGTSLAALGIAHVSIAKKILEKEEFRKKLDAGDWTKLGEAYFFVAEKILEDEDLCGRNLEGKHLETLAMKYPRAAHMILLAPEKREKMVPSRWAKLAVHYPFVTEYLLENEEGKCWLARLEREQASGFSERMERAKKNLAVCRSLVKSAIVEQQEMQKQDQLLAKATTALTFRPSPVVSVNEKQTGTLKGFDYARALRF